MSPDAKHWSYSAGERGQNRVRVFEDNRSGVILAEFYEPRRRGKPRRTRVSLGHRDRERAKEQADVMAAEFAEPEAQPEVHDATLGELFDMYLDEVTPEKSESTQRHDHRAAELFLRLLGRNRKAATLNRRDWDAFVANRRRGSLAPTGPRSAGGVGNRVITYDLKFLVAVLNWAVLSADDQGVPLLERNPLRGLPFPKVESPNRPRLTPERYDAMRAVADQVDWRFGPALTLAWETGHRIGAIRKLRWSDVDLQAGTILWRGDVDKIGMEHTTPLTPAARAALEVARTANPAIGDAWVFPSPKDPSKPVSRHLVRDWWYRAEALAELEHVKGLGWHGCRRQFATDLKHEPLPDLCQLGGWKSPQTVLTCYQQPDEDTMRAALARRGRLRGTGT